MATTDLFEIDEHHLRLLQRLQFTWSDDAYDGAPAVDLKRPYGNSDVLADVRELYAEAYGFEYLQNEIYEASFVHPDGRVVNAEDLDEELWQHHKDMPTVLEILSSHPTEGLQVGPYRRVKPYGQEWERYGDSPEAESEGFVADSYFTVEPHARWVKPGQIPIEEIAERVYGKAFDSLRACQADNDTISNDSVATYLLGDSDTYEKYLSQFDDREIYLGYNHQSRESITKTGMTDLEYWLTISWTDDRDKATVDANPEPGTDLEGAVFPGEHYAQRAFSPSLGGVIADLIRRGELPRGNYLFKHWW